MKAASISFAAFCMFTVSAIGGGSRVAWAQPAWLPPEARGGGGAADAEGEAPCGDRLIASPLALSLGDRARGSHRGACLASTLAVDLRGIAILDDARATDSLAVLVRASWLALPKLELGLEARVFDLRGAFAADGDDGDGDEGPGGHRDRGATGPVTLAAAGTFGPPTLGGLPTRWSWRLMIDLPYTDSRAEDPEIAVSPQVHLAIGLDDQLVLHGRAAALLFVSDRASAVDSERAIAGSIELAWAMVREAVAVSVGTEVQAGPRRASIEHWMARGGAALALRHALRLRGSAGWRIAGDSARDWAIDLGVEGDL